MTVKTDAVNNRKKDEETANITGHDESSSVLLKDKEIKKEISRLKRLFKDIPPEKLHTVVATIEDAAFSRVMVTDLRQKILREGTSITYQNGENQYGEKQSPDAQLYLQFSQKLNSNIKILLDCLPKDKVKVSVSNEDDSLELANFLKRK